MVMLSRTISVTNCLAVCFEVCLKRARASVSESNDNVIFVFDVNYTNDVTFMEAGQGLHSRALHKIKKEVVP